MPNDYAFSIAVPTEPANFTAVTVNATSVMLVWTRPATPNGIITSYTLVYFTPGQPASMIVFEDSTLSAVVGLLNEFTEYTFELFASTSVGGGPNATDTASTDAAGMLNIVCNFVGSLYSVNSSECCTPECCWDICGLHQH